MDILNKAEVDVFLNDVYINRHSAIAIKGPPPMGMKYSDGTFVVNDVNVAWKCVETGETCKIHYGYTQ